MEHPPLAHSWHLGYVGLSYAIAALTSLVSLELAARAGRRQEVGSLRFWRVAQALLLGYGIWAMHFVGMLAFVTEQPSTFQIPLTALSGVVAVVMMYAALSVLHRGATLSARRLTVAGSIAGAGIVAMHYTGMAAYCLADTDVSVVWGPLLASVAIAVGASMVALYLFRLLSSGWAQSRPAALLLGAKALAALVMGVAITGMHYTGMAALRFGVVGGDAVALNGADHGSLALMIGVLSFMLIGLSAASIAMDAGDPGALPVAAGPAAEPTAAD